MKVVKVGAAASFPMMMVRVPLWKACETLKLMAVRAGLWKAPIPALEMTATPNHLSKLRVIAGQWPRPCPAPAWDLLTGCSLDWWGQHVVYLVFLVVVIPHQISLFRVCVERVVNFAEMLSERSVAWTSTTWYSFVLLRSETSAADLLSSGDPRSRATLPPRAEVPREPWPQRPGTWWTPLQDRHPKARRS